MTAFPDLRLVMDEVLVQGDRIEYHWRLIGTNTGPGGAGDPLTILVALVGIAVVTLAAAFFPAHPAASIDPMRALRIE
jgi:hypothetical protein